MDIPTVHHQVHHQAHHRVHGVTIRQIIFSYFMAENVQKLLMWALMQDFKANGYLNIYIYILVDIQSSALSSAPSSAPSITN